jgi:hypothetical protein
MPDLDQIKQGEQEARDRQGRLPKGGSGDPNGDGPTTAEVQDRVRGDAFKPSRPTYGATHHAF